MELFYPRAALKGENITLEERVRDSMPNKLIFRTFFHSFTPPSPSIIIFHLHIVVVTIYTFCWHHRCFVVKRTKIKMDKHELTFFFKPKITKEIFFLSFSVSTINSSTQWWWDFLHSKDVKNFQIFSAAWFTVGFFTFIFLMIWFFREKIFLQSFLSSFFVSFLLLGMQNEFWLWDGEVEKDQASV